MGFACQITCLWVDQGSNLERLLTTLVVVSVPAALAIIITSFKDLTIFYAVNLLDFEDTIRNLQTCFETKIHLLHINFHLFPQILLVLPTKLVKDLRLKLQELVVLDVTKGLHHNILVYLQT